MNSINLKTELQHACEKGMAALRTIVTSVPAGGHGDKVSPPTHEKGQYAFETRVIDGRLDVSIVLLEAPLDRISAGEINFR